MATVDAVLEAAAQVFDSAGYADATTDRIAARAGVSIGSLYQYFASKDAILEALVERHIDAGADAINRLLGSLLEAPTALRDTLRTIVEALVSLHEVNPNLHRVLFEEVPLPKRLRARLAGFERTAAELVAQRLESEQESSQGRTLSPTSVTATAHLVVIAVDALAHRVVLHPPEGVAREALLEELVQMLECYLDPARRRSRKDETQRSFG